MLTKYRVLGILLAVALVVFGTWKTIEYIYANGYEAGVLTTEQSYERRLTEQATQYNTEVQRLKDANDELTESAKVNVNQLDTDYIETLEQKNAELQAIMDSINTGSLGLYDHGVPTPPETGPTTTDSTADTSCEHNAAPSGRLSKETSRVLVGLTGAADRNTEQLAACQTLVRTYLDVISQYNQSLSSGGLSGSLPTGK